MGDVNWDGRVNIDDYAILDGNIRSNNSLEKVTGPRDRSILVDRPSGTWNITEPGVYENFRINRGQIVIHVDNVTLRNFVIQDPTTTGATIKFSSNDLVGGVVEYGEIFGGSATNGVSGSNYRASHLHIHHMQADAFRVKKNVTIEWSYIHDIAIHPDAHGDGVQMYPTDGGNMVIRNNTIDARGGNAALFQVDNGWVVERNHFLGGNYTVYASGHLGNVFRENVFGTYKYGSIRVGAGEDELIVWERNVTESGDPVVL